MQFWNPCIKLSLKQDDTNYLKDTCRREKQTANNVIATQLRSMLRDN
jgi:hypothetical protein